MKVETPQILWNSEGDKGRNAPLYSIDMLESGMAHDSSPNSKEYGHVLATAGNTNIINLWRVSFDSSSCDSASTSSTMFQKQNKPYNKIDYMTSLARHELPVNTVGFSPDGLHLVTAGEAGNIVVWSVPITKRGNGNGRHFWSTVTKETDLSVRIVSTHCEGVCDISWSADSKRFCVGTIDACVLVLEDKHHASNQCSPDSLQKESEWAVVYRNGHDHTAFVQGVAYDPLGVYLASMGSDRTVRVFPRKTPPKSKKNVLRPTNCKGPVPPPEHQRAVGQLLTGAKFEFGKSKQLKHRRITVDETGAQVKQKLYCDESTCESFFRRLSWTTDGAFLVTPAALWHTDDPTNKDSTAAPPSFSTHLFARHRYDEPYMVLSGLEKPSVVVRPNPVLFKLPESAISESKENQSPQGPRASHSPSGLPYRSIFAVLTLDSVLIYDTHHSSPLSIVRGLHYAGLTDCTWSKDGHSLMVCSTDGYISILNFSQGELGLVYTPPAAAAEPKETTAPPAVLVEAPTETPMIPPCEPGPSATLSAPPTKKAKTRITPTLISTPPLVDHKDENECNKPMEQLASVKRTIHTETETVGAAVTKMSLSSDAAEEEKPKKKKKRIQPVLISSN